MGFIQATLSLAYSCNECLKYVQKHILKDDSVLKVNGLEIRNNNEWVMLRENEKSEVNFFLLSISKWSLQLDLLKQLTTGKSTNVRLLIPEKKLTFLYQNG